MALTAESTGVYWEPVNKFDLVVGNAEPIRNVPGRKTDVKDAEWLADLLRHGLIKKSFVPTKPFRGLRVLTRYRRRLVDTRSSKHNRPLIRPPPRLPAGSCGPTGAEPNAPRRHPTHHYT